MGGLSGPARQFHATTATSAAQKVRKTHEIFRFFFLINCIKIYVQSVHCLHESMCLTMCLILFMMFIKYIAEGFLRNFRMDIKHVFV